MPSCCDIPLFKGSVAGLPLICTEGGAPGYKSTGRSRIHDSIEIINSINSNLMSKCSACLILTHRSGLDGTTGLFSSGSISWVRRILYCWTVRGYYLKPRSFRLRIVLIGYINAVLIDGMNVLGTVGITATWTTITTVYYSVLYTGKNFHRKILPCSENSSLQNFA
jgi:hypothetical protein